MGFIQDYIVDKKIAAYDKAHGTNIHSYYQSLDDAGFYDDYCSLDRQKIVTAQKEDIAIITTLRNEAKKESLGIVAIFLLIVIIVITVITKRYFKKWRVN